MRTSFVKSLPHGHFLKSFACLGFCIFVQYVLTLDLPAWFQFQSHNEEVKFPFLNMTHIIESLLLFILFSQNVFFFTIINTVNVFLPVFTHYSKFTAMQLLVQKTKFLFLIPTDPQHCNVKCLISSYADPLCFGFPNIICCT